MINDKLFTKSNGFCQEYCCSIVKVEHLEAVPNCDNLVKAIVNGRDILINKAAITEGQVMFYADNETQLLRSFLQINNQYRNIDLNVNKKDVEAKQKELEEQEKQLEFLYGDNGQAEKIPMGVNIPPKELIENAIAFNKEYIKRSVGFFEDNGRVRMIKLRGNFSMGYLFDQEQLAKRFPEIAGIDLDEYVGTSFDTVCGMFFCKAYIPPTKGANLGGGGQANKLLKGYDQLVEGEFMFHYDTSPLYKCIERFKPEQEVIITRKIHGTSAIFANVKVRKPGVINTGISFLDKFLNFVIPNKLKGEKVVYDTLYASRRVILNQYIFDKPQKPYYNTLWESWSKRISPYVEKGYTLYCEIVGYDDKGGMIQSNYDYGCDEQTHQSKLMIYRITTTNDNGTKHEMELKDVIAYTDKMVEDNPTLKEMIFPMQVAYQGTWKELYPDLDTSDITTWREHLLSSLKCDQRFYMEMNEPLCTKYKVPAEGIVVRICNDPINEAFKLKPNAFYEREAKNVDKGIVDIEMGQN